MTLKKVLVTGATGFVGNFVVRELLRRNISIVTTSSDKAKAAKQDWFEKTTYIQHDIFKDAQNNLLEKFKQPDLVIHLAWDKLNNFKDIAHVNEVLPAHKIFLETLIREGIKELSCIGTCLEYGLQEGCLDESIKSAPIVPYACSKNNLRLFLEQLESKHSLGLKWIRLFYLFGVGQNEKSLIPSLQRAIDTNESSFKMSSGDQVRDFLQIEKAAEYIVNIALQSTSGIFNCCSNKPTTVKDFVEDYLKKKNKIIKLELGYYPYPDYEPHKFWGNNSKLKGIKP
jgi:nucleoside-diphosphate-sugar epimerase